MHNDRKVNALDVLPGMDAVEVVRCKNCQKCFYDEEWKAYVPNQDAPWILLGLGTH